MLLGDREQAGLIYPLLLAFRDRPICMVGEGVLLGPTGRTLGDLALLLGRVPEAMDHYQEAVAFCQRLGSPHLLDACRRALDAARAGRAPPPSAATPPRTAPRLELHREGDVWAITGSAGAPFRLKHAKGLGYLSYLLEQPGREVHVLELMGTEHQAGDAGPVLDPRAKAEYRRRLDDLRDQLEEAERFGDLGRVQRAQDEIEAIAAQLAGAVGLGGRDRRAASDAERARINVQRRLKGAIDRITAVDPELGRYLAATVRTGSTCAFVPI